MLPQVFWVKCQNHCHGECQHLKSVKNSKRKTNRSANFVMVSLYYTFYNLRNCILNISTEKQIDLKSVDLKKLKVRDLKKILNDWDEGCDGCLEKGDFIKRIEELKPKHIREEL